MNPRLNSVAATLVLMVAVIALVVGHTFFSKLTVGIAIQVAAALLMIWARLTFGIRSFHAAANPTQGGLVTNGPYRYWRHPIYAAVLIFVWTGVLTQGTAPSVVSLALAAAVTVTTFIRIFSEEKLLNATFPDYPAYAAHTRRLIPFVY
jgi:protein-S-isoprenylcysteine O-methyltransferase Ste14